MKFSLSTVFLSLFLCASSSFSGDANHRDYLGFNDAAREHTAPYPDWFASSSGNLKDDLLQAIKNKKDGIIIYYKQEHCAYCDEFIKNISESTDIQHYLREHYDIIPVDIWGVDEITDTNGHTYTEHELALRYHTNFTPSLVFYDAEGTPVFRLRGYHPPYNFMAALTYSVEKFYKNENFRDYLDRAVPGVFFKDGGLNSREFFRSPPYNLKNILSGQKKPVAVFFEQGRCHACDVLHTGPLNDDKALAEIANIYSIQLDMWSETPITTPSGDKTTARKWADKLGLFYAPTIIFFDTEGNEIIRLDSVVKLYRLLGVLQYINTGGYLNEPNFQKWRLKQRKTR